VSVREQGQLSECCDRGVWRHVGWTGRATYVEGVKRGVCGVCEEVGELSESCHC